MKEQNYTSIRNIAIIAHVDHGKTTLTDKMMEFCGAKDEGASMDNNALEQERGITIYAKNTSVIYNNTKINIVDTPGHADFGSEVERVLRSIDAVLLLVDAQEGPMPQTRFVLKKSLELGLKPIVVFNKIDKPGADCQKTYDSVLELFIELGADDSQLDFRVLYAIGRDGVVKLKLTDENKDLTPLFETILSDVPVIPADKNAPLQYQIFNLAYDNFLGRMGLGRIYEGTIKIGQQVIIKDKNGVNRKGKINELFGFHGIHKFKLDEAYAGDIVMIAGIPDLYIGETIIDNEETQALPMIHIDEPTIELDILVNNSPFAGKEGKFVTSRQIKERLERELEVNVGLKVDFDQREGRTLEGYTLFGRGEMHISVLLETMRREGFEMQVSQPRAIIKDIDGVKSEPFEEVIVDIKEEYQGAVIEKLAKRGAIMSGLEYHGELIRVFFEGPTRGLFGYRNQFVIDTKGEGILSTRVLGFKPYAGPIEKREAGSMISMESGKVLGFSLDNLQTRGRLYISPAIEVYEGMVVGNTSKGEQMVVNPCKGKQLTNMRSSGNDDAITLIPPYELTIERGLEVMADDEYLEITPKSVRLRKIYLTESERSKYKRK